MCTGRLVQRDMGLKWWYAGIELGVWLSVEFCIEGRYPYALLATCKSELIYAEKIRTRVTA